MLRLDDVAGRGLRRNPDFCFLLVGPGQPLAPGRLPGLPVVGFPLFRGKFAVRRLEHDPVTPLHPEVNFEILKGLRVFHGLGVLLNLLPGLFFRSLHLGGMLFQKIFCGFVHQFGE